ncbi:MAG: hypothetical protein HQL41_12405 [Alphaproteobacteria bacterium]|nr:hypothetical protein [Alphaproteobacteria bacterium]
MINRLFPGVFDLARRLLAQAREEPADQPILVARGTGCSVALYENRLRIRRGGALGLLASAMGWENGFAEHTIRVSDISAIDVEKPVLFMRYVRFSYPGAPALTGRELADMMAENAVVMNLFDNRDLYAILARIEGTMDGRRASARATDGSP